MGLVAALLWVFAVFPVWGCAEVTGPPPGTAPVEYFARAGLGSIDGVELCQTDNTSNCVTTGADGKATLWLPVGETSFTTRKDGYGSYLIPLVNPAGGRSHDSGTFTVAQLEALHEDTMTPYPLGNMGRISCNVSPTFAGATFDLFDASGPVADPNPYYVDQGPTPTWSLDLTATTGAGSGGFLEVSPDEYRIGFGGTAEDCVPIAGWPGFASNSIRLPVRAGYITQVFAACERVQP